MKARACSAGSTFAAISGPYQFFLDGGQGDGNAEPYGHGCQFFHHRRLLSFFEDSRRWLTSGGCAKVRLGRQEIDAQVSGVSGII